MMEPVLCTTSTSSDGADVPMSIKQEPDDGPQTVLHSGHSDVKFSDQQHLADQKFCKLEDCKDDIPIINDALIVTSSSCSINLKEYNLIGKSESGDGCNSSETPTSVNYDVPNVTQNLYEVKNEVKNEVPCPIHGKMVHNNRLDVCSELAEVKRELDCKPEIVNNVVLGDVNNNIQTNVQHNDTVNQKLCASTNNCDIEMTEETTLDSRTSRPMIPRDIDDSTDPDVDNNPSHLGSDVQPTNCSNIKKQLSTQDDAIVNMIVTAYINEDHNSVLCDKELCEGTIKSFSCTRCDMSFTSKEKLTSHCETLHIAVIYKCKVCERKFTKKSHLTRHLRMHTSDRPFECPVCDKRFACKDSLTVHLRVHSGEPPIKCDVWEKSLAQKCISTRHLRMHSGERSFKCNVCYKSFTRKRELILHLWVHIGEGPFKCDVCEKSFAQKSHLATHLRIHSGERPFKCNVCDKRFPQECDLTKHVVIHNGEQA